MHPTPTSSRRSVCGLGRRHGGRLLVPAGTGRPVVVAVTAAAGVVVGLMGRGICAAARGMSPTWRSRRPRFDEAAREQWRG